MRKRDAWLKRIKSIERQYEAAWFAASFLLERAQRDPSLLGKDLRIREVKEMTGQLEGTYLIRLFAEFETGLRQYWLAA